MARRRASPKRYAQAVFELALSENRLDPWAEDLHQIKEVVDVEEFRAFLQHAKVFLDQKVKAIGNVLPGVSPLARNLLSLMVSRGLVEQISQVEEEYLRLLDQHRGRERVEVSSAVPLESQQREHIRRFVQAMINREVVLEARVDPSILGGLILRVGDKLLDGSTKARLEGMRKELQTAAVGSGT